MQTLQGKTLY